MNDECTKHDIDRVVARYLTVKEDAMTNRIKEEREKCREKCLTLAQEHRETQRKLKEKLKDKHNLEIQCLKKNHKELIERIIQDVAKHNFMSEAELRDKLRMLNGGCRGTAKNGKPCPNKPDNDPNSDERQRGFCERCRPSVEYKSCIENRQRKHIADTLDGKESDFTGNVKKADLPKQRDDEPGVSKEESISFLHSFNQFPF